MDNLERYDHFMRTIDRWTEEVTDTQGVPFKHLRKGALVREVVVSPGFSISVARLKTYFATDILEIFPRNISSRVTWRDIRRFLAEEDGKKYNFDFGELEKCFSPEENREAAGRTQLIADNSGLTEHVEVWEDIPVYLLEKLREKFQRMLGEYWHICDADFDESKLRRGQEVKWKPRKPYKPKDEKDEEDMETGEHRKLDEQKLDKYMECLTTLALHEIFVRKLTENRDTLMGEFERHNKMLEKIPGEMTEVVTLFDQADDEGKKKLAEQVKVRTREEIENIRWFEKFWILQLLCLEHNISLGAEIQIVMLLEKKRLEELRDDKDGNDWKVEDFLEFMERRFLTSVENYNRNKKKYYTQLEADVRDVFVRYLRSIPWPARRDITGAVENYLKIVEKGRLTEEERTRLWYVQSIIACPLMDMDA